MYNFNHLYYFYMTAKSGGFSTAAEHLHISQPSLSSQIKVLEQSLDIRLFEKVGRNNQLTPSGSVVYGYCRQMFEISEEMGELISRRVPAAARRIHIGISKDVDRRIGAEIISSFLKGIAQPEQPKLSLLSGDHSNLTERLRFRELDAVIGHQSMMNSELSNLERVEIPVMLLCATDWKVPRGLNSFDVSAAIHALVADKEARWLLPSKRFSLRSETDRFFEQHDIKGRVAMESDDLAAILRGAVDGVGITFLPLLYAAGEIAQKTIRAIGPKEGFWKYRLVIASHSQNKNDELIRSLARAFKSVLSRRPA